MVLVLALTLGLTLLIVQGAQATGTRVGRAGAPAAVTPSFLVPSQTDAKGVLPRDLATGDFNGDGNLDAVTGNDGPAALFKGGIGIMLGDGSGHLASAVVTPMPQDQGAFDVAVADFDADGKDDVATIASTTGGFGPIIFLHSNGDGTVSITQQVANTQEGELVTGDFNADGKQDVVFSSNDNPNVKAFLGNGDGTFTQGPTFQPLFGSYDLAAGDLDLDSDLDLTMATGGSPIALLNDGTAHFSGTGYHFDPKLQGIELTLDFFNADALLDVAIVDASGGHVQVGLGDGTGHFTAKSEYSVATLQTTAVTSGDFTGDGKVDLVANSNTTDSNVLVELVGRGDGTFGPFTQWVDGPLGLVAARMDTDPLADVVSFTQDPGTAYVMRSAGLSGFRAPRVTSAKIGGVIRNGDLNADGRADVVIAGEGVIPGHIRTFVESHLNRGSGKFGPAKLRTIKDQTAASGTGDMRLADVNEDGKLDVVGGFTNFLFSSTNLFVSLGKGDGTFQAPILFNNGDTNSDVGALAVADVTGDGHLDVVTSTLSKLSVKPGNGDGTFGGAIISGTSNPASASILVDDFTGDGTPDAVNTIVTGGPDFSSSDVIVERGNGDGTFLEAQRISIDANVGSGGSADFDGNGRPDVAVIGSRGSDGGHSGMFVFLNQGGTLGTPTRYEPAGTSGLAIADFNADVAPDVATSALVVNVNAGDGTFSQTIEMIASGAAQAATDFTGDGKPEIATGTAFASSPGFVLYVNDTP